MEIKLKLKLESGQEIELTPNEEKELFEYLKNKYEKNIFPVWLPSVPNIQKPYIITCHAGQRGDSCAKH